MNVRHLLSALVLLAAAGAAVPAVAADTTAAQSTNATADVAVDDQVATETVTVSEATLSEGGFLAVYNSSGGLVGVSERLSAGTHENVTVGLSPALERSQVVVVEAYSDDGDGAFNASADAAYTNANDNPVSDTAYVADEPFSRSTATATDDAAEATTAGADATETTGPGLGVLAALLALAAVALLARR